MPTYNDRAAPLHLILPNWEQPSARFGGLFSFYIMRTIVPAFLLALPLIVYAVDADTAGGFGSYESSDIQTKFVVCEQAIYERNYSMYDRDILVKGGLSAEQAEADYEDQKEANIRMLFFRTLAQAKDLQAFFAKQTQVRADMFAAYEQDADAAVREYKRLGDLCLRRIYPVLIARHSELVELDKSIRTIRAQIPEDLEKKAKAEFLEKAMKTPIK